MKLKKIPSAEHYIHIALSGKLVPETVPAAAAELAALLGEGKKPVIVDVTEVTTLSPEGIRMFLTLAETQYGMVLYNPQPVIREQMETAGFSAKMFLTENLSEALQKVETLAGDCSRRKD